jgi:hypothetical protein
MRTLKANRCFTFLASAVNRAVPQVLVADAR